jgi:RNA-directed DNA polymerase
VDASQPRRGEACLIRYADDFVCAFQYQTDAERCYKELDVRLGKFGLQVATEKTRVIPFDRRSPSGKSRFQFLGFEFYWGKDRSGKPHLKRQTSRKKLRGSIKRFSEWCKENRNLKPRILFRRLNTKLRGYYNYYGVYGNDKSLMQFFQQVKRILFKWLNRQSQRRSYNWGGSKQLLKHYRIEQPRIKRRRPKTGQLQLI